MGHTCARMPALTFIQYFVWFFFNFLLSYFCNLSINYKCAESQVYFNRSVGFTDVNYFFLHSSYTTKESQTGDRKISNSGRKLCFGKTSCVQI